MGRWRWCRRKRYGTLAGRVGDGSTSGAGKEESLEEAKAKADSDATRL